MAAVFVSQSQTASAGVARENVGAEVVPGNGEGYKVFFVHYQTDLGGGGQDLLELRESTDSGANYTTIWSIEASVARQLIALESGGKAIIAPTTRQARGSTALRYQWAVTPGAAANTRDFSASGRTSKDE